MSGTDSLLWLYVALVFACGLALVASAWPAGLKALVVAAVTALYFVAAAVLADVWGWPARQALPERFVLLAVVIDEPTRTQPGALHLWVHALEGGKPAAAPRAYRLPYRKDLHALLGESMKKVRQGVSQMGSAEPRHGPRGLAWLRSGADEQDVKIRDLPSPQLPEK